MKREDVIRDIHALDAELAALEEQYGLLSADFHHFFKAAELEQSRDFIRWAGFYETKLERESHYRQMIYEHPRELCRRWTGSARGPRAVFGGSPKTSFAQIATHRRVRHQDGPTRSLAGRQTRQASDLRSPSNGIVPF